MLSLPVMRCLMVSLPVQAVFDVVFTCSGGA